MSLYDLFVLCFSYHRVQGEQHVYTRTSFNHGGHVFAINYGIFGGIYTWHLGVRYSSKHLNVILNIIIVTSGVIPNVVIEEHIWALHGAIAGYIHFSSGQWKSLANDEIRMNTITLPIEEGNARNHQYELLDKRASER